MASFIVWAPFQIALFNGQSPGFEGPIFQSLIFSAIIAFFVGGWILSIKSLGITKQLLILFSFLIPAMYWISKINAASSYMSTNMLLITLAYIFVFIAGVLITHHRKFNVIFQNVLIFSFYLIVWFGLLNWLGQAKLAGTLFNWIAMINEQGIYQDAVMSDSNGLRLTSVFQYANTYAAFLIATFLGALYFINHSLNQPMRFIHSFMLIPILLSLLLTLSRGALVLFPIIFIVLLCFLKPTRQLIWIFQTLLSLIGTVLIINPITNMGIEISASPSISKSLSGYGFIIVASLVISLNNVWITSRLETKIAPIISRLENRKLSSFYIPLGSAILGTVFISLILFTNLKMLFPENIQTRIENINFSQHSVLERQSFNKDSLKLFADYPLLGAGGGAWNALWEKYQSYPYTSRQSHNFYLQQLDNIGLLGSIVLFGFLFFIFYKFIRSYIRQRDNKTSNALFYFMIAFSILFHSALDFNMSYIYIAMLVFFSLGGMTAIFGEDTTPKESNIFSAQSMKILRICSGILIMVCSFVLFIFSVQYLKSTQAYENAVALVSGNAPVSEIVQEIDEALHIRPSHSSYVNLKASLLQQGYVKTKEDSYLADAMTLLREAREKEPFNKNLFLRQVYGYQIEGENDKASELLSEEINKWSWDINLYETKMKIHFQIGYTSFLQGDDESAKSEFTNALSVSEAVKDKQQILNALPEEQFQGREFEITTNMNFIKGQIEYLQGHYQEAAETLKALLPDSIHNETEQEMVRWYLAALQQQQKFDQQLYDQLITQDSIEAQKISELLSLRQLK